MMNKPGRNQPCPCGSGKKYKVCCLRRDEAARIQEELAKASLEGASHADLDDDDDDFEHLDADSNRVIGLIRDGRLDDAEAAAQELLTRYPGLMDGHLRLAMVYEARQQPELAAAHYRDAAACLDDDCAELRDDLLRQADELAPAE